MALTPLRIIAGARDRIALDDAESGLVMIARAPNRIALVCTESGPCARLASGSELDIDRLRRWCSAEGG